MKKLIETTLPLSKINKETIKERTSSPGHPGNLHMWWGRSPRYSSVMALQAAVIDAAEDTEENVRRMKRLENVEYADCGNKPIIFDPFSGFGGISLAAQELGFPVIAGDLNPVAVILTKAATEIPQRFMEKAPANPNANKLIYAQTEGLAEDVLYYGKWMQEQAQEKLKDLYPNEETGKTAAWIWARTVQCPNPACSCQMPMASSFIINSKAGHEAWAEPIVENGKIHFKVHEGKCPSGKETNKYRNYGARFRCPACGEITADDYVKKMGISHKLGSQMMAMVIESEAGKAVDILEGRRVDPTFYPVVYGLKDDEDWEDEANWYKVNPSLGYTVDIERLRDAYREAKQNPADEITFKWLRMNMWVSSTTSWIPDAIFMKGDEPIDMRLLEGRDCYAGLDLSSTGDITALVLIFPPRNSDEKHILVPYFWVPEETIPQRVKANSVPYDVWEKQGHLLATEGNVIHYDFIEKFICDLGEKYHILEIAVDRWNATQMIQNLEGAGFTMVPFGQGFASMSTPTKEFYRLLMEGQIIHAGHPVLRWMAGNVVIETDAAENIKVTKAKSKEKIDGIVASIMALDRCIRNQGETQGSVYDERGLLVF